jgi:hypothetical protein
MSADDETVVLDTVRSAGTASFFQVANQRTAGINLKFETGIYAKKKKIMTKSMAKIKTVNQSSEFTLSPKSGLH